MGDWLDEIEAQSDSTVPYYVPRLIAEIRRLRAAPAADGEARTCDCGELLTVCASCARADGQDAGGGHGEALRAIMRQLVGWLSADIPELHTVEVPRLADSLDRFLSAPLGAPTACTCPPPSFPYQEHEDTCPQAGQEER